MALARMEDAMESRKAVSNFKSCWKALIDTIPPGHRLTDAQELIVLSNLQVVESAIQVSHIQQSTAVYNPNASGTEHNPCSTKRLKMEVLIRWRCHLCSQPQEAHCDGCNGKGYIERWVPYLLLNDVRALVKNALIIRARRKVRAYSSTYLD